LGRQKQASGAKWKKKFDPLIFLENESAVQLQNGGIDKVSRTWWHFQVTELAGFGLRLGGEVEL